MGEGDRSWEAFQSQEDRQSSPEPGLRVPTSFRCRCAVTFCV
jgi:hypothetical protein